MCLVFLSIWSKLSNMFEFCAMMLRPVSSSTEMVVFSSINSSFCWVLGRSFVCISVLNHIFCISRDPMQHKPDSNWLKPERGNLLKLINIHIQRDCGSSGAYVLRKPPLAPSPDSRVQPPLPRPPLHTPGVCLAAGLSGPVAVGGAVALAAEPLCPVQGSHGRPPPKHLSRGRTHLEVFLSPEQDRQALPPHTSLQPESGRPTPCVPALQSTPCFQTNVDLCFAASGHAVLFAWNTLAPLLILQAPRSCQVGAPPSSLLPAPGRSAEALQVGRPVAWALLSTAPYRALGSSLCSPTASTFSLVKAASRLPDPLFLRAQESPRCLHVSMLRGPLIND